MMPMGFDDPTLLQGGSNSTNFVDKFGSYKVAPSLESLNLNSHENGCLSMLDTLLTLDGGINGQLGTSLSLIKDD